MSKLYLGNETAVAASKQFLDGFQAKNSHRGLLLCGQPGLGKTWLTEVLAEEFGLSRIVWNSSDKRRKGDMKKVFLSTQVGDSRIVVLDECEKIKSQYLSTLLKGTKVPLFLCCNFVEEIDWKIKKLCQVVRIEKPAWWIFKQYIDVLAPELPESDRTAMAQKCKSYRHAQRIIDDPEDEGSDMYFTKYEEIEDSLKGYPVKFSMSPDELIHWINDNSNDPDTISRINIILERTYLSKNFKLWKYAYKLLGLIRSDSKVEYPTSFIRMSKAKRAHQEGKNDELAADTKLTLDPTTILDMIAEIEDEDYASANNDLNTEIEIIEFEQPLQTNLEEWL